MSTVIFDIAITEIENEAFSALCENMRENLPRAFNRQCRISEGCGHSAALGTGVFSVRVETDMARPECLRDLFSHIENETRKQTPQANVMIGPHAPQSLDSFVAEKTASIEKSFPLFSRLLKL